MVRVKVSRLAIVLLGNLLALLVRQTYLPSTLSLLRNALISILRVSYGHCQEVINRHPEGDSLVIKFHSVPKKI